MDKEEKRKLILIVGGSIALFALIALAVIALDLRSLVQTNRPQLESALSEAVADVLPLQTIRFDEYGDPIIEDDFMLPDGLAMRGTLTRGQRVEGTIGMYRSEAWMLEAQQGETFLLDFDPLQGGYFWQMEVYQPDHHLLSLTADSDAGYADFSLLNVKITVDGTYFVVLRALGEDGPYALKLE